MAVHLVCEGFRGGLDERALDALVIQFRTLSVLTAASGGDKSLGAVRQFLETRNRQVGHPQGRTPVDVAISVEDRNHRPLAHAENTWANRGGRGFIWRRHEIENYLLHPRVVLELFNELRSLPNQRWAAGLPATEADVETLLRTLAIPLLADHAAEVLRAELVQAINGVGMLSFGPPRPAAPSGSHAPGQVQWLTTLTNEATRLSQTCAAVAALPQLQVADVTARYNTLLAHYQAPTFLTSGEYLREMGGHELLGALSSHLHGLGGVNLSQPVLANELLRILARIYAPRTLFVPDDFAELADILAQY